MTVQNVTKMWSKTGGSLSSEKLTSIDQVWAVTEGYQVLADIGDSVDVVVAAIGIPRIGNQHPTGIDAYVESVSPEQISPIFWQVVINYRGLVDDGAVDIEWTDSQTTEPIDRDFNGRAIVTVNNEPVEGLSMDVADQVVVIRRRFLSIDTAAIAVYRRATNSDTFLGWPPGTARLIGFSAKNSFLAGAPNERWDVTARVQFREPYANTTPAQAWYKRWRHEGLYAKVGSLIQRAVDDQQQDVTKPVLLKADGTRETNPDNAVFIHTQVYGSLPYSGLGLI
jgi:hypothetical protein